ncbi:MAG: spermidine/putrescine ABC transporter substrate-binding protein [Treponema sp.]|jgi:spermidine/putrescine-binding protein|nr:spermidine/putrescine ABC transporter substrate-binding protein [Treponema sp.]
MNKIRFIISVLALCVFPQLQAQKQQMIIYTWEEMFPQEILDGFERANPGLEIVYETFDYNENMFLDLQSTEASNCDLVIADDYIIEMVIENGLAQKLDKRKLSNLVNVNPFYQHQFFDPRDEYTVPYGAGVQTIVYDPAKVRLDIKGYSELWNSSLRNSVGVLGNYRVMNGMALKALGKSYNTEELADIRNAGAKLKELAPNVRMIDDSGLDGELLSGRLSAAIMYTDQAMRAKQQNPGLKVVFPREGIGFGIMAGFIPANAPNADAAHRFLNYILDARRGAQCFEYLGYYCTYSGSEQYIKPELREFLVLPKFNTFEMIQNFVSQAAEDEHQRIWAEFETAVSKK